MSPRYRRTKVKLAKIAETATKSVGSITSLLLHSIVFLLAFSLPLFGVSTEKMLLVLTTFLSIEAIYLAILIQMTVNKNTADIEVIQEDVGEIQEDIEEIEKDVDEIQEDIDEIQEDVDEIQEDIEEIEKDVDEIQEDVEGIEEDNDKEIEKDRKEQEYEVSLLTNIQATLIELQKEIEQLKKK